MFRHRYDSSYPLHNPLPFYSSSIQFLSSSPQPPSFLLHLNLFPFYSTSTPFLSTPPQPFPLPLHLNPLPFYSSSTYSILILLNPLFFFSSSTHFFLLLFTIIFSPQPFFFLLPDHLVVFNYLF